MLVFLHLGSRKVFISKSTRNPDAKWMKAQAAAFARRVKAAGHKGTILMRDRDGICCSRFDEVLCKAGIELKKNSFRSPNLQAHIERFIQSLQQEALDHFVVFGEKHFDYLISEFVKHYHTERPHQALDNRPLTGIPLFAATALPPRALNEIVCHERLGGLLKHYVRCAA